MTAAAVAFVLVPLLRTRAASAPTVEQANLDVLRAQRAEIDADVASGTLPAEARAEALDELVTRAAEDLSGREAETTTARRSWPLAIALGVAIPALAFGLYATLGNPGATDITPASFAKGKVDDKQIVAMVENLARKVRERPDDAQGWALLGRSMSALGRFDEAADAYAHLLKLTPNDPQVMADYADTLAMVQGRTLKGRPYELARQALAIEPTHPKALAIAGTAALDEGDFPTSLRYWQTLADSLPADSPDAGQVREVIAEVRTRAAEAGKPLPGTPKALAKAPPAAGGKSVTGSVAISPALAANVSGNETLFIFARAEKGPRVPLAVVRATAKQLPMRFALDDSQAMAPGVNISSAEAMRIEARISRSGNASPQSGDLVGTSAVVKPGAREVYVVVDRALP
jgi:cytochrome c-type biogenesis protein CcmH